MINLLHAGAVPLGYTSDASDCDFPVYVGDCCVAEMSWLCLPDLRSPAPLPDVILSNTPPPSPLRRARSCLVFFPEKPRVECEQQPASPLTPPATPGTVFEGDTGVETVQAGLGHIQEVRRRLQIGQPHLHNLPQLSWPLPRPPTLPSRRGSVKDVAKNKPEDRRSQSEERGLAWHHFEEEEEERRRWRHVGGDLRKVADQFQLDQSKASGKASGKAAAQATLPAVLGRCVAASLLCLVWWRLYNKLR